MTRIHYSRICRLITDSLHSVTVLNKIKCSVYEFDSDNGDLGDSLGDITLCHSSAYECLQTITHDLVFILVAESRYVRHLAGNVIVSLSEFVVASRRYWEEFVQLLCFYFEIVICKVISPSSDPLRRDIYLGSDLINLKLDLRSVVDNAGWGSVGAIVSVLCTVLKTVKDEDNEKVVQVYLDVLGSCLQNIPWDLCNGILVDDIGVGNDFFEFIGYLVQLFCSVVSVVDPEDDTPAFNAIYNIFPKILKWCFGELGENCHHTSISQYIRYKILVLMIRLSPRVDIHCTTAVSWLNLIRKYFKDLLFESVNQPDADQDDCLKDSPFNITSHQHLQRRVVFLYLRCAFSLIGLTERHKKQGLCGDVTSWSKEGFTALYEWLEKQLPENILMNSDLYDESCKSFTKSFIQLYMHEDDILFEVLLQLTNTQPISQELTSSVVGKDMVYLLSDIFNPVHLFHIFLSELHYDHQVLLDYLISKDTGASCAEYLLRCLRIICDNWNSFLGFPFRVEVGRESFHKQRKLQSDLDSASDEMPVSLQTDDNNKRNCKQPFYDARDCLLQLKKSVASLHQKDLFPYNPEVLLRRYVHILIIFI
ncbi:hypothetical protein CTI12_AA296710 [Artemisia annua]|uniref:Uncharacterized protein n=1 Tax=Artemisia annua TaxID=35608 RepID=A0A2U1LMY6_ARTAN|nr:hypothetical protein CTI12_AA296710 [Artemisia annua]